MKNNVIKFQGGDTIDVEYLEFDYTILYAEDIEDLEELIRGCIDCGWRPHGAPFVAAQGMGYCQAMRFKQKTGGDGE